MQSRKRFSYLDNTKNSQPPRSGLVLRMIFIIFHHLPELSSSRCYPQADYAYYGTDQTYIRGIKISSIFSPATMRQPLAGLGGRLHRNTQAYEQKNLYNAGFGFM